MLVFQLLARTTNGVNVPEAEVNPEIFNGS
jgi:hypothetical protein